jgi:S-adenosylmethionine/arginine decarboxylase-like enzyme
LHIWDEHNPALLQLDVYSCSNLHEDIVFKHLEQFKPEKIQYKLLDRNKSLITVQVKNRSKIRENKEPKTVLLCG